MGSQQIRGERLPLALLTMAVSFLLAASPALALQAAFDSPASDTWFPLQSVPVAGNASGPASDARTFNTSATFTGGAFEWTNLTAAGAVGLVPDDHTTYRYFEDFSSPPLGTAAVDLSTAFHTGTAPVGGGTWVVQANTSGNLSGAPALGADTGRVLHFHATVPRPIVAVHVSFRYATTTDAGGTSQLQVTSSRAWDHTDANGRDSTTFNQTTLLNTGGAAVANGNYSGNLTGDFEGASTVYLSFDVTTASAWAAIDDLTVDIGFFPTNGTGVVNLHDDFASTGRPAGADPRWWFPEGNWTFDSTRMDHQGSAVERAFDRHFAPSGTVAGLLGGVLSCSATGSWVEVAVSPGLGGGWTALANHSGTNGTTTLNENITAYLGPDSVVLRLTSLGTCRLGSFSLTLELVGDVAGIERGTYTSPAVDVGSPVDWGTAEFAAQVPAGCGVRFEVRTGANTSAWSSWVPRDNGSALPGTTGQVYQFRATLWAPSGGALPNLTSVRVGYRGIAYAQATADNWSTTVPLTLTYLSGASFVNWSGTIALHGGTNNLTVRAYDTTGAFVEVNRTVFADVFPPPAPEAPTGPAPFTNATALTWGWGPVVDYGLGLSHYEVRVGTTPGGSEVVLGQSVGNRTQFELTGAADNVTYYAAVRAADRAGNRGPWSNDSAPVLVDLSAPQAAQAVGPARWVNTQDITWSWPEAAEGGTGVAGYEVQVGTAPGGAQVGTWAIGQALSTTLGNVTDGTTYYLSVRAADRAGNVGLWGPPSDAVTVDRVGPAAPDLTVSPSGFQNVTAARFGWVGPSDAGAPVASFDVMAGSAAGADDILPLTTDLQTNSTDLVDLPDGGPVFFSVRAVDAAGNVGAWATQADPLLVDRTPPPAVTLEAPAGPWADAMPLAWAWAPGVDSYSGTVSFLVRLGRVPGADDVARDMPVNVPSFSTTQVPTNVLVFATVRAVDGAGNVGPAVTAAPVGVDLAAPFDPPSLAGPASPAASAQLQWTWGPATDVGSGVVGYEVSLGTGPGLDDVVAWEWTDATSFQFDGAISGTRYHFSVRAVDGVGWRSPGAVAAAPVLVDLDPPEAVSGLAGGDGWTAAGTVVVAWQQPTDAGGSGVASYEVEVTTGGETRTQSAGPERQVTVEGADASTYTVRVRALDGAGNMGAWSAPFAFGFDRTAPLPAGPVNASADGNTVAVAWPAFEDGASGVAGYFVSVGTQPGLDDLASRVPAGNTSYTWQAPGPGTYFVTVVAADRVGNEAASEPVAVVVEAPPGPAQQPPGGQGPTQGVPLELLAVLAVALLLATAGVAWMWRRRS